MTAGSDDRVIAYLYEDVSAVLFLIVNVGFGLTYLGTMVFKLPTLLQLPTYKDQPESQYINLSNSPERLIAFQMGDRAFSINNSHSGIHSHFSAKYWKPLLSYSYH